MFPHTVFCIGDLLDKQECLPRRLETLRLPPSYPFSWEKEDTDDRRELLKLLRTVQAVDTESQRFLSQQGIAHLKAEGWPDLDADAENEQWMSCDPWDPDDHE